MHHFTTDTSRPSLNRERSCTEHQFYSGRYNHQNYSKIETVLKSKVKNRRFRMSIEDGDELQVIWNERPLWYIRKLLDSVSCKFCEVRSQRGHLTR